MSGLPEFLRRIKTIEDLEEALGELTPEERARLDDPALYAPPTQEELAEMQPFLDSLHEWARRERRRLKS